MSLFQKTVVAKFLKTQPAELLSQKWEQFREHFHNPAIQENIRGSKEEQYQEGFLRDLFVNIFGYTLNPSHGFNLTTEYKNIKDSKKADGAVILNEKVSAIIELKGTNTTDLSKIEEQAFGYKNNQKNCRYVVTSNFEKLRFYIDDAIEQLEFNLFEISQEQFNLLYLCLALDNIAQDVPGKIKDESLSQEDAITKKLYREYSVFKRELFQNLTELNPDYEPLELFKKSQKLLDRLLFLFFGEDRGLLPPNSVRRILDDWNRLKDLDEYIPLYNRFKKYFGYLNTGFKGKNHDVFAYNGGLFKPDEILDNVRIADELLYRHTAKLADYDFASEVDVNILGHIFENSLNELDEVKAQLEGQEVDKSKTKRKKDGVFYTPKYITKYIVQNTVGKLCEEKKAEFKIIEEEYSADKNRQQKTKKILLDNLQNYRDWLLKITIVDPACGSGAFLNEALNFLIAEHHYIDELEAKVTGSSLAFAYHSESILENNLFGVDLNEESVEIAKLSLWLRTAEPNRKLNSLNDNIKCGNSLIDDPEIAGEKAFDWQKEFPKVFANGGFDVVIGNPPYVRSRGLFTDAEKKYYLDNYKTTSYQLDLYKLFIEKSCKILLENGRLSFITPSVFLTNDFDKPLRKFILDNFYLEIIANSDKDIFGDASVKTVTFVIQKNDKPQSISFFKIVNGNFLFEKALTQKALIEQNYLINEKLELNAIPIIKKMSLNDRIGDYYDIKNGIKVRKELIYNEQKNEEYKPFVLGKNVKKYFGTFDNEFVHYTNENEKLYTNQAFRNKEIFEQPKLIVRQILGQRIVTNFDEENFYTDQTTYVINEHSQKHKLKYLLTLLNSKLLYFYFANTFSDSKITFPKVKRSQLLELPIKNISLDQQQPFIEKAETMLQKNKELQQALEKFQRTLQREFNLKILPKKLQNWNELSFPDFLKEVAKLKINLSLQQKDEWEEYFGTAREKAEKISQEISKTDSEIDQMVYQLYGLTNEEIAIVENA